MNEKMDINENIPWDCDPEQNKSHVFTVPDGNYVLTAWNVELSRSKAGDPKMNIRFGINGTNGDKWLYHTITLLPKTKKGHGFAIHALKTLGFSVDKSVVNFRPSDIIGRVCRAEVRTEEYDTISAQGNPVTRSKNVIKDMLYALPDDKPEMPKETPSKPVGKQETKDTEDVPF